MTKIKEKNVIEKKFIIFQSLVALKTLIEDSWAQIKPSGLQQKSRCSF